MVGMCHCEDQVCSETCICELPAETKDVSKSLAHEIPARLTEHALIDEFMAIKDCQRPFYFKIGGPWDLVSNIAVEFARLTKSGEFNSMSPDEYNEHLDFVECLEHNVFMGALELSAPTFVSRLWAMLAAVKADGQIEAAKDWNAPHDMLQALMAQLQFVAFVRG